MYTQAEIEAKAIMNVECYDDIDDINDDIKYFQSKFDKDSSERNQDTLDVMLACRDIFIMNRNITNSQTNKKE